ncbi:SCP2 sterol-binding domain-containing protein [Pelagibius sp. Alg239-R121]|uniref:SCP2 sterol-binding domain-containing protein n=1 Tax=Pelagibius sp. Alg239-R121 TaxID=2993448 RepID=UPI0024A6C440|nr:SCP2 sterol-binding domain-containing protein [Pelagibius sp. Alg239-R121]
MTLEELTSLIKSRASENLPLGYRVKFDINDLGVILWDGTETPAIFSHDDEDSDATVGLTGENLEKLMNGSLDPTLAFMTGKIKVSGSKGVVMKLSNMLES